MAESTDPLRASYTVLYRETAEAEEFAHRASNGFNNLRRLTTGAKYKSHLRHHLKSPPGPIGLAVIFSPQIPSHL